MYIIPYFVLLALSFVSLYTVTKDKVLSLYSVTIGINAAYCYVTLFSSSELTPAVINHFLSVITAYYVFDIHYQLVNNHPDRWTYITHHIATIQILLAHANGTLPLSVGVGFLSYFEYSNTFLQLFQLFNKKGWKLARGVVSLPFVLTYVPLRLVAIPLHSLKYVPYLAQLAHLSWIRGLYLMGLIGFVDVFSMYFAVVVAKKAVGHFVRGEKV